MIGKLLPQTIDRVGRRFSGTVGYEICCHFWNSKSEITSVDWTVTLPLPYRGRATLLRSQNSKARREPRRPVVFYTVLRPEGC